MYYTDGARLQHYLGPILCLWQKKAICEISSGPNLVLNDSIWRLLQATNEHTVLERLEYLVLGWASGNAKDKLTFQLPIRGHRVSGNNVRVDQGIIVL